MKAYYAHCMAIYDTPQEKRDLEAIRALGFEVFNPNCEQCRGGYKKFVAQGKQGMEFFRQFIDAQDVLIFRGLPDGSIPAGVGKEIVFARESRKPVLELPTAVNRRTLTIDQTREYLLEIGER